MLCVVVKSVDGKVPPMDVACKCTSVEVDLSCFEVVDRGTSILVYSCPLCEMTLRVKGFKSRTLFGEEQE